MDSSCKLYIGIEPIEHIVLNLHNYMALPYNLRNKTFVEMLILEISNIYNWKPLHIDSSMICSDLNGEECDADSRQQAPRSSIKISVGQVRSCTVACGIGAQLDLGYRERLLASCSPAPSVLTPKRPYGILPSFPQQKWAITNPQFGVYVIYIYLHLHECCQGV